MSEQQKSKEFVLGGEGGLRRYEVSNSCYFPPSSLNELVKRLWSEDFLIGNPNATYKPVTDHDRHLVDNLTEPQLSQLFGIELTPNGEYISHLNLKASKPDYSFKLELENHLKRTRDLELQAGYYNDKFHYISWTEVHVKITGDGDKEGLSLIEQIVCQTAVKSKSEHRTEEA